MAINSKKDDRSKNWRVVVYPDSLPENWRDILDSSLVPWCESPLHEFDVEEDKPKKPHYHLILAFSSKKSYEQVCEFIAPLNCPIPLRCADIRGAVRYLAHLDSPNKYQYPANSIIGHNGFDPVPYLSCSTATRYEYVKDMCSFIVENGITEFSDFFLFCSTCRYDSWYPLLCDNSAYVIERFIKSFRHRSAGSFVNYDTGEVICSLSGSADNCEVVNNA